MKTLLEPISVDILEQELNENRFIRNTNKGNNDIYIVNHHNAPNVMLEIGRLRELTFRAAGGGTGEEVDIDKYDTSENCYQQLIVWSREEKQIIGGYRYIDCGKVLKHDKLEQNKNELSISTYNYFKFSDKFINEYMPYTIELGRSWVQPAFQPAINPRKGVFALDNIWDGLGTITVDNPHIKYFFGKVTMYRHYNATARDMVLYFLFKYFPDAESLLEPLNPLPILTDEKSLEKHFVGLDFKDAFKVLNQSVRNLGENIPPLINIYMNLSSTMKTFGTAFNPHFGNVEETGIMVTIDDIYPEKKERHISTYPKK